MISEGQAAPDFELTSDGGERIRLSALRGRPVILYFYPKDDTPGCTRQACDFRDTHQRFLDRGAVILGVSPDSESSHVLFKEKHGLPFTLLADPGHTVAEAYGAWGEKTNYGKTYEGIKRSTFVIDPEGKIVKALYNVKPDGHADRVYELLP